MDIVLDQKKPVWFLDEPLSNLDAERRHYFWKLLEKAFLNGLETIFFIDHWMSMKVMKDKHFKHLDTLVVVAESRHNGKQVSVVKRNIDIYENRSPENFLKDQTVMSQREKTLEKNS